MEPIAIVGLSIKFPGGADTPEGFWRMMEEKQCAMEEWPKDRVNLEAFVHRETKQFVPGAHFMKEDCGLFDASFFGISGAEACAIDPQSRLLLETAYHAFENAGIPIEKVSGSKTAVFTGCMADDYKNLITHDAYRMPKYAATGAEACMLSNRLSWFYNLQGPSVTLDSACSSSLLALDLACQSLRNNESDMALVTGSNIILAAEPTLSLMNMNFTSPQGRCFSFDARANGYGRGEGVGVLIIKRLNKAIEDSDTIRAVVRSTGSNQDGRTPGLTQPKKESQARLIADTYKKAGLDLSQTRFFEAHGTGTALGDLTEIESIRSVFRTLRSAEEPLYVGAVKSNIGHLEGASGIAGIVKAVLMLEKGLIPPNANFETISPSLDAEFSNIKIAMEMTPWPTRGLRRVSIASFGYGGTNSHAVLDDAYHHLDERGLAAAHCTVLEPQMNWRNCSLSETVPSACASEGVNGSDLSDRKDGETPTSRVFVWSAEEEAGVRRMIKAYQGFFAALTLHESDDDYFLEQLATTLAFKRSQLRWRSFVVAESLRTLRDSLESRISKPVRVSSTLGLGYIFTGQGAQHYNKASDLLRYPVFRDTMTLCQEAFRSFGCGWALIDLLDDPPDAFDINDPIYAQPLTTAVQLSLVDLFSSWGLKPQVVIGHSSGEIAAAYAAGGLSLSSACKVSYFRGVYAGSLRQSNSNTTGAMLAVNLSETAAESYLSRARDDSKGNLCIACINSPSNVTVSGDAHSINCLKSLLHADNIASSRLWTGVAYHSPQMLQIVPEYERAMEDLTATSGHYLTTKATMISSVTGKEIKDLGILSTSGYWVENLCSPVQFSAALTTTLLQQAERRKNRTLGGPNRKVVCDWLEIGPHSTLQRPFQGVVAYCDTIANKKVQIRYTAALDRNSSAIRSIQHAAGTLYALGYPVALDLVSHSQSPPRAASGFEHIFAAFPRYPFNHTKRYWHETLATRNIRLRPQKTLEFLGAPAPESTSAESRWRKIFDASQSPWLLDHAVNGQAIYAGTGMIVMAVEGARQLADQGREVTGYFLHDAIFLSPISISQFSATETNLYMRPSRQVFEGASHSYDFRIYTEVRDEWQVNCWGQISIQYASRAMSADGESLRELEYFAKKSANFQKSCVLAVPAEKLYKALEDNGLTYGSSFRVMNNIHWDGTADAVCDIKISHWTPAHSQSPLDTHVVHPATLDGLGQLGLVTFTRGGETAITSGLVATRVREAWMAGSGITLPETQELRAYAHTQLKGSRGTETTAFALDSTSGKLKLWLTGLETTSMSSHNISESGLHQTKGHRDLCFVIDWKPDLTCLSAGEVHLYCGRSGNSTDPVDFLQCLERLMVQYAHRAMAAIGALTRERLTPHLQKYAAWLERLIERAASVHHESQNTAESQVLVELKTCSQSIETLENNLLQLSPEGEIYLTVGRNLTSILNGTASPLQLLYGDGPAADHYKRVCNDLFQRNCVDRYIRALTHKNPRMKILEVGTGTGSMASLLLQVLSPLDGEAAAKETQTGKYNFSCYDYTDISESFFEQAKDRYAAFGSRVGFRAFDMEQDPQGQGFECGSYDLVVAAWVIHVARDVSSALRNVRKLLKPGGKLLLLEIVKPDVPRGTFVFGTLPGWWAENEVARGYGPGVSEEDWATILQTNGFSGVDLVFRDYEMEECRWSSLMMSTATVDLSAPQGARSSDKGKRRLIFVVDPESNVQRQIVDSVVARDPEMVNSKVEICSISDLAGSPMVGNTSFLVFLCEMGQPILIDLAETEFGALQRVLCKAQDVLWVTAASPNSLQSAEVHIVDGLAKVLCSEKDSLSFITAHLGSHQGRPEIWAKHIHRIISNRLAVAGKTGELEYREMDGMLCVGRIREAESLNNRLLEQTQTPLKLRPFQQNVPLISIINSTGLLDATSVVFAEDPEPAIPLEPEQIEIEVRAVGVNFRDVFVLLGKLSDGDSVGLECSGVVTRVGASCFSFQPGERVCAIGLSCLRTLIRVNLTLAIRIPDTMSFAVAASLPVAGITAHYSLVKVARLERGESVLIHSGAGGTGQMAVQVALALGAEVFVTVGTEEKKRLLQSLYRIPEDHILCSRDVSFQHHIRRLTEGRGVDVVLNSLSGDGLVASWECVAPYGRFVELGKSDLEANSKLPMFKFKRNVSFSAIALDQILQERPGWIQESMGAVMALLRAGRLTHPSPVQEFPVSAHEDAYRLLQSGKNAGKLVLNLSPTDLVQTSLPHSPSYAFPADATYVIAGGLGGLGRSAARWMTSMGAKNLILLSRSGPVSNEAQQLVRELDHQGVRVTAPRCNLTSPDALTIVLQRCRDWPPIRGCIQGTMVLQDSIFENLTFEQWDKALRAKVQTTQNLHTQLPSNLEFFILLSSLAGIVGSVSQANYAAGNTFQDAFAAYRQSIGQRATSLDLGYMADVGIVAETTKYASRAQQISNFGSIGIRESEFHVLLEVYCDTALHSNKHSPSLAARNNYQLLVGLTTPGQLIANGIHPPEWLEERNLFGTLCGQQDLGAGAGLPTNAIAVTPTDYHSAYKQAGSAASAAIVVINGLKQKLSRALGAVVEEIDMQRSLALQGVDSLLAVDLRLWISRSFRADISALDIVGSPNLDELVILIVARSEIGNDWVSPE